MFSADDYGQALASSFLFYEAQRSGDLPATNRIPWRRDSALGDGAARYDANNNGQLESNETLSRDLAGGYYDAGDRMKYAYPLASSLTLLSWGATQYQDAYEATGQLDEALDAIKWGTDWLLKAHETTGTGASLQTVRLWGQVGRTSTDHNNISDDQNIALPRPAYFIDASKPGSDLAAEVAASFASASILFRAADSAYADQLLNHAQALYKFAYQYQGRYSNVITDTAYPSSNYNDDLAWGAVWLHKALESANGNVNQTLSWAGNQTYLQIAKSKNLGLGNWTQTWGDKEYGTAVLIAQEDPAYNKTSLENWLNYWTESGAGHIAYSPGGLAFLSEWGSLRLAANTAFLAAVYSDTVRDYNGRYADFAQSQIDYMLGDNPRNSSYLVGFGADYSRNPHHANAHLNNNPAYNGSNGWTVFNSTTPNYNLLTGALVGGPGSANDFDYQDNRLDYVRNEVALDYNAAFTGVLAYLYQNSAPPIIPTANLSAAQTLIEGQFQPQSAVYTVTLTEASNQTITLNYSSVNGTALAGLDYGAVSGSLTFAPGVLSQTIAIPILNDDRKEGNETFTLTLSNPNGAVLGTSSAVATLTDTLKSGVTTVLPAGVENLTLSGAGAINGTGNGGPNTLTGNNGANQLFGGAGNDTLTGKGGSDLLNGGPGADVLTGGTEGDIFQFQWGESGVNGPDRIKDLAWGGDKIDLLTSGGADGGLPTQFSRASDQSATNRNLIINAVFSDADGQTPGAQPLAIGAAALVVAPNATYLIINDVAPGFQSSQDLLINLTGYSGALPALGAIAVGALFT
ncbi:MAG: hypothetical protein GC158_05430 [Cyanobacteria bacterium RI_101]|nr:hypothetical protein [Cyanobacteria bacterium RI_101]